MMFVIVSVWIPFYSEMGLKYIFSIQRILTTSCYACYIESKICLFCTLHCQSDFDFDFDFLQQNVILI